MSALNLEDVDVDEARHLLLGRMKARDTSSWADIYVALRNWTWRMLRTQREVKDLWKWHELIRMAASVGSDGNPVNQARLLTLGELVEQTARFSEANPAAAVMQRDHVRPVLDALTRSGGEAWRHDLMQETGLREANLSRVLLLMEASGLVQREQKGRKVRVRLTGYETLSRLDFFKPKEAPPQRQHVLEKDVFGRKRTQQRIDRFTSAEKVQRRASEGVTGGIGEIDRFNMPKKSVFDMDTGQKKEEQDAYSQAAGF